MMELYCTIIEWLNENQGAVMAGLTVVYVTATIVIVWTSRSTVGKMEEANKLTSEFTRQAEEMEKERTRPYVVLDLMVRGQFFRASLKNYGLRPAYRVRCSIEPELIRIIGGGPRGPISFVENEVPLLVPGRQILDLVGETSDFLKQHEETAFRVTVTYADSLGTEFIEEYNFSVSHYMHRWQIYEEGSIKKVEKHLQSIASELKSLKSNLTKDKPGIKR